MVGDPSEDVDELLSDEEKGQAASLPKFRSRADLGATGEPATLGVIVGFVYSCQRPDGVAVVAAAMLGPCFGRA